MPSTSAIHWLGAGLSSGPGIVALTNRWKKLTVWDLMLDRAQELQRYVAEGSSLDVRPLNLADQASRAEFCAALKPGDIVVSMLPANFHVRVAQLALSENCHMVTSSYLSDDMIALNDEAVEKGLSIVNEVGLDPGIDHLLSHLLIDAAQKAGVLGQGNCIDFISYCGGIPVEETPFTYKFSWTPLGVLTALKNPALIIKDGKAHAVAKAWDSVASLAINDENFEVYPNRDSLPYIEKYGLGGESNLRTFVRGTLRLEGWKAAWKNIFTTLETASPEDLKTLSDRLWREYPYAKGEQDRVVLHVALKATLKDGSEWKAALSLDHAGSGWQSAMAACVSLTVAEAVNALVHHRLAPGVQPAPHDVSEARRWLEGLKQAGIAVKAQNVDINVDLGVLRSG